MWMLGNLMSLGQPVDIFSDRFFWCQTCQKSSLSKVPIHHSDHWFRSGFDHVGLDQHVSGLVHWPFRPLWCGRRAHPESPAELRGTGLGFSVADLLLHLISAEQQFRGEVGKLFENRGFCNLEVDLLPRNSEFNSNLRPK